MSSKPVLGNRQREQRRSLEGGLEHTDPGAAETCLIAPNDTRKLINNE